MTELSVINSQHFALGRKPDIAISDLPALAAKAFHEGEACHTLGIAHFYGLAGLSENRNVALDWFKMGVRQGNVHSAICAGRIILDDELKKNYPNAEVLTSAIAYLEQGKDEGITEIGYPDAVKIEDLIATARTAMSKQRPQMPRPTATILDISRRSQRNA